jgi:hypothetical protein
MSRLRAGAVLLLLICSASACGGIARGPAPAVDDDEAVAFSRRIEAFYSALEDVAVASIWTYDSPELHGYFTSRPAFDDYFASLATQVRRATLRDGRVERIEIREFRLTDPDHASVDLELIGRHERELRFWEIELPRTDTWVRVRGTWTVRPDRL